MYSLLGLAKTLPDDEEVSFVSGRPEVEGVDDGGDGRESCAGRLEIVGLETSGFADECDMFERPVAGEGLGLAAIIDIQSLWIRSMAGLWV
jgi:hypothetical protein